MQSTIWFIHVRQFLVIWVSHFFLSALVLVGAIAGATDAHEEGRELIVSRVVTHFADVLLLPIVASRRILPESLSLGFSPLHLALNSALWAGVGMVILRFWRVRRGSKNPTRV